MKSKKYPVFENEESLVVCDSSWGGRWTEDKLETFEKYVEAYLLILNKYRDLYNWKLIYLDGFAGSGSREEAKDGYESELLLDLFNESLLQREELNLYKGAAERVLNISQRGFDYYYFVEKSKESCQKLEAHLAPYSKKRNLVFRNSDANEEIQNLAEALKNKEQKYAALVLLDPFGMQVNWSSIELLKGTRTDLWILIPTGVIVNRLLDRKGKLVHIEKLVSFFGKEEVFLRDFFYTQKRETTLFGEIEMLEKVHTPIKRIAELYIQQLQGIFKYVTQQPLVLYNTRHTPIFHFACASNNEAAIRIANSIIGKKQKL